MGGKRQPPSELTFKVELGGEETQVFHYRSGIVFRVDDHKVFRDLMDCLIRELLKGKSLDCPDVDLIRGKLHLTLRRMLWAGDSVLSFFDFSFDMFSSTSVGVLPIYHSRRWDIYSGW